MGIGDWIILILNIACLIGSIVGALKAHNSYKKCKQLTNFANLKIALDECQLIFDYCRKLLKHCGDSQNNIRGENPKIKITEYGYAIKNSFSKIKEILPATSQEAVNDILSISTNHKLDIEKYVSLLVSGQAIDNDDVTIDNISEIEKAVGKIQLHIKKKMENMQESDSQM